MLLELTLRNSSPVSLRIAVLFLLLVILSLQAVNPSWFATNRILASLPIQRFKWKSETFLSSSFNRSISLVCSTLAFSVFIYAHYFQPDTGSFGSQYSFLALVAIVLGLFLAKLLGTILFFGLHEEQEMGIMVVDYSYAFNQLIAILLFVVLCFDVFVLRLSGPLYIGVSIAIGILYLLRLLGNILMLLNNFNYPIISLFIYLCAFEIIPMLAIAKVLFVNS